MIGAHVVIHLQSVTGACEVDKSVEPCYNTYLNSNKQEQTMKTNYTMHIYKADRRCKTGVRPVSRTVWTDRTEEGMVRECVELAQLYPAAKGYRFEYYPAMK